MIIHARIVEKPRQSHYCDVCKKIANAKQYVLFGMAERGDPPYTIRLHDYCFLPGEERDRADKLAARSRAE